MDALDVISLDEAKGYLKIDFPDEDDVIKSCIKSAVAIVERKTQYRLFRRTETIVTSASEVEVFQTPLNAIVRIDDGAYVPLPVENYWIEKLPVRTVIRFNHYTKFIGNLENYDNGGNRTITIDVGYDKAELILDDLLAATRQLVTFLFQNRNEAKIEIPSNISMVLDMNNRAPYL